MAVLSTYETFTGRKLFAFRMVDRFAAAMETQGPFPPLIGGLRFYLSERTDHPNQHKYDPPREVLFWRSASGAYLTGGEFLGPTSTDPTHALGPGSYTFVTRSDYYEPSTIPVAQWPPEKPIEADLLPKPAYPIPAPTSGPPGVGLTILRGTLCRFDGSPQEAQPVNLKLRDPGWTIPKGWVQRKDDLHVETTTSVFGEWMLILRDQARMQTGKRQDDFDADLTVGGSTRLMIVTAGREQTLPVLRCGEPRRTSSAVRSPESVSPTMSRPEQL